MSVLVWVRLPSDMVLTECKFPKVYWTSLVIANVRCISSKKSVFLERQLYSRAQNAFMLDQNMPFTTTSSPTVCPKRNNQYYCINNCWWIVLCIHELFSFRYLHTQLDVQFLMISCDIMSSQARPLITALSGADIARYWVNVEDLLSSTFLW